MCGIVGFVRNHKVVNNDLCDAFQQIWWGTQLRGVDGSGIFQVNDGGGVAMEKSAFTPDYSAYEKSIAAILRQTDMSPFTVAHCRAATKKPTKVDDKWLKKNAHPFQHGDITLVHNGFFSYVGQDHNDKHEVDSESFTNAVADVGIDEALNRAYGAYALVYYDKKTETLNIARNNDRPLWRVEHYTGHFYVSEPELAIWILKRNKLPAPTKIEEVPIDKLIQYKKFDLGFTTRDLVQKSPARRHKAFTGWESLTDEEYDAAALVACRGFDCGDRPSHYPSSKDSSVNDVLSLNEVISKAGRFCWDDAVWISKSRSQAVGWKPRFSRDYEEWLATSKTDAEKEEDRKVIDIFAQPHISEVTEHGMIKEIYHQGSGFSIKRNSQYVFSVAEAHGHKGFCAVIGIASHAFTHSKVRIMGNMNVKLEELKSNKRMVEGTVMGISKSKENGRNIYIIQVRDIKFTNYIDIRKVMAKMDEKKEEKKEEKPQQAILLISKKEDGKEINIDDLVTCPGCKTITHKADIKPYTKHLFKDEEGRTTTQLTVNVCRACHEEIKGGFDDYYQNKYLPAIKSLMVTKEYTWAKDGEKH